MTVAARVIDPHSAPSTAQVENTLLRSNSELRVLAYHAAIGDDKRTANLQVCFASCLDPCRCVWCAQMLWVLHREAAVD